MEKYGFVGIYPIHYLSHNMVFLARAYGMEGRYEDDLKALQELRKFYLPHMEEFPDLEGYEPEQYFVYLRFHKWDEISKLPPPDPKMKITNASWHYSRALAFLNKGEVEKGKEEQALFKKVISEIPEDTMFHTNKAHIIFTIADDILEAQLTDNLDYLKKAVTLQDHLNYNEPTDFYYPVRESLGVL